MKNVQVWNGGKPVATALDRVIAVVSPGWAAKRVQSRMMLRAYEGAQRNRRTVGWKTSDSGPVTEVRAGRSILRQRSRDLVRNNAWAARAVGIKVSNQIGTGIRPRAATGNPDLNRVIDTAHEAWAARCAPDSGVSLYGLQALAARGRAESGESLVMLHRRRTGGSPVPLSLQVIEADWLADEFDPMQGTQDGWADGIQFDSTNRRVAYRLWANHPKDGYLPLRRETRDVPASDVIHLFRADRPGQIRGIPDLAVVMMRMRDLDDYHDAALMLAKVQAVLGAFVTQNGGPMSSPLGAASEDADGNKLEELAPGIVAYLNPGEDVKFLAPQGGGPFKDYTRSMLHMIAAGLGVTYHQLTGDLSDANYSSMKAGALEFRRLTEQDQHLMLIPMLCQPIWDAFIQQAVVAGVLPREAEYAPATFTPPAPGMIDPGRDTEALKSQIRSGLITWPEAVSEMGYDPDTQLQEIAAWNARLKEQGVVLDIDPRLVTATGGAVNSPAVSATVLAANGG